MDNLIGFLFFVALAGSTLADSSSQAQPGSEQKRSIAQTKCMEYMQSACNGSSSSTIPSVTEYPKLDLGNFSNHMFVVGGKNAYEGQFPHMARVGYKYDDLKTLECGGSLISKNFVLGAAHCLTYNGIYRAYNANWVVLGSFHQNIRLDKHNQEFMITKLYLHPDFNEDTLQADIALFQLDRDAQFNEFIRPICLNTLTYVENPILTVSGWGDTKSEGEPSEFLKYVHLNFQPEKQCNDLYPAAPSQFNSTTMVCVGWTKGDKDACQGDSGGPLNIDLFKSCGTLPTYSQVGVVSFGKRCGDPNTPAAYTRVSFYVPWIENIVWPSG